MADCNCPTEALTSGGPLTTPSPLCPLHGTPSPAEAARRAVRKRAQDELARRAKALADRLRRLESASHDGLPQAAGIEAGELIREAFEIERLLTEYEVI